MPNNGRSANHQATPTDEVARVKSDMALDRADSVDEKVQDHEVRLRLVEKDLGGIKEDAHATRKLVEEMSKKGSGPSLTAAVLDLLTRPRDLVLVASSLALIGSGVAGAGFGAARATTPEPTIADLAHALEVYQEVEAKKPKPPKNEPETLPTTYKRPPVHDPADTDR